MNKTFRFLMVAAVSLTSVGSVTAENNLEEPPKIPTIRKSPKRVNPASATYNSGSTELTVNFPATNGGKVEIYRNGTLVVSANASAGATLNYILRNYGTGNYTVVVSCGNTVVYSNSVEVK
ncbi:MAG: hypothetical protein IKP62_05330 [Salinivirgaceae bacterium]|nr:hypothetical protein [Salinivirgaceae bacterium]